MLDFQGSVTSSVGVALVINDQTHHWHYVPQNDPSGFPLFQVGVVLMAMTQFQSLGSCKYLCISRTRLLD